MLKLFLFASFMLVLFKIGTCDGFEDASSLTLFSLPTGEDGGSVLGPSRSFKISLISRIGVTSLWAFLMGEPCATLPCVPIGISSFMSSQPIKSLNLSLINGVEDWPLMSAPFIESSLSLSSARS